MTLIGGRASDAFTVAAKTDTVTAEPPPLLVEFNGADNDEEERDGG